MTAQAAEGQRVFGWWRRARVGRAALPTAALGLYCALCTASLVAFPRGYDWTHHLFRVQELAWLWRHGMGWPAVSPFSAEGSLLPVYAVYAPLPYCVPAGLSLLGVRPIVALYGTAAAAWGGGALLLQRMLAARLGGPRSLVASLAVFGSAYWQGELLVRFAYAELLALSVLPGVLPCVWALVLRFDRRRFVRALSGALLVLALHPLTFVNCALLGGVAVLATSPRDPRRALPRLGRLALLLTAAALAGAGVTWPLLTHLPELRGQSDIAVAWGSLADWLNPTRWTSLGLLIPGLAVIARWQHQRVRLSRSHVHALLAVALMAGFLASPLSAWWWEHAAWPRINTFPTRFLPYLTWPLLVLLCSKLDDDPKLLQLALALVGFQVALCAGPRLLVPLERAGTDTDLRGFFDWYASRRSGWGVDEFLPLAAASAPKLDAPQLPYSSREVDPERVTYHCPAPGCAPGRYALPGYHRARAAVRIDGVPATPSAITSTGATALELTSTARTVSVTVSQTHAEHFGKWLSALSALTLVALLQATRRRRPRQRSRV
ncbi:MAG: hypothetical protein ABW321_04110 [Polyangiales bacterium]